MYLVVCCNEFLKCICSRFNLFFIISLTLSFILPRSDITISLEQSSYSVAEDDGFVEVCAVLIGQLARDVEVELRPVGDTACELSIVICMQFTSVLDYVVLLCVCMCVCTISLRTRLWKCVDRTYIL